MNNQTNRTRDKRIRTGSIALRIALGSALYLLLAFVVVDVAVLIVAGWPQIEQTGWRHGDLQILIPAMRDLPCLAYHWCKCIAICPRKQAPP